MAIAIAVSVAVYGNGCKRKNTTSSSKIQPFHPPAVLTPGSAEIDKPANKMTERVASL